MRAPTGLRLTAVIALLAAVCPLTGCGSPQVVPDPDLTTVHGAFLKHHGGVLLVERESRVDPDLLDDSPVPPGMRLAEAMTCGDFCREGAMAGLEGLQGDTWDALMAANATPTDLSRIVSFSGRIVWLPEEDDFDETTDPAPSGGQDEAYDRLFRRHPGAEEVLALSMPGISEDGTQALLYVESMSGCEAGSGDYYLLVREGGVWKIVARHMAWVA